MKKYLLAVIVNAAFIIGCSNHEAEKQTAQLLKDKDSLISIVNARDSATSVVMNNLNDIEANLEEVKKHQELISASTSSVERTGNIKDRINDDIVMINNLMDENKKKIAYLTTRVNETSYKMGDFEKLVGTLKDQIMAKDAELKDLNDKLLALNTDIVELKSNNADLTSVTEDQMKTINNQTDKMHTAYYVVGNYNELKKEEVIDKNGGILGMGSTQKVKADFNPASFRKIDITETSIIPIAAKKVEILSTHPSSSYELEKDGNKMITKLVIKDPERFWEASKYLVVMKD